MDSQRHLFTRPMDFCLRFSRSPSIPFLSISLLCPTSYLSLTQHPDSVSSRLLKPASGDWSREENHRSPRSFRTDWTLMAFYSLLDFGTRPQEFWVLSKKQNWQIMCVKHCRTHIVMEVGIAIKNDTPRQVLVKSIISTLQALSRIRKKDRL